MTRIGYDRTPSWPFTIDRVPTRMNSKTTAVVVALLVAALAYLNQQGLIPSADNTVPSPAAGYGDDGVALIAAAYRTQRSDIQVQGSGIVKKVLRDDLKGSRHQRFLLRLSNDQTLLVAHNIDLAPRIDDLQAGDRVVFYGEYEWNSQGGVIHWTHHDPAGRHADGWLRHNGRTYQ